MTRVLSSTRTRGLLLGLALGVASVCALVAWWKHRSEQAEIARMEAVIRANRAAAAAPYDCRDRDFCGCSPHACRRITEGCICSCDYHCEGSPECRCECGGGRYLGCMPRSCPALPRLSSTDTVTFDEAGCAQVVAGGAAP